MKQIQERKCVCEVFLYLCLCGDRWALQGLLSPGRLPPAFRHTTCFTCVMFHFDGADAASVIKVASLLPGNTYRSY